MMSGDDGTMNGEGNAMDHETDAAGGAFISGGFRPTPPTPPVLPRISEVEHGTLYQDADGTLWRAHTRATNLAEWLERPEWVRVEIVTAEQRRHTQRTAWAWLANLALPFVAFACWFSGLFTAPIWTALILFAYGAVAFSMYTRTAYRLKRQLVAPDASEITS